MIQFARLGQHVWHYTIWYGAVCTLATILGQYLCDEYVRKRGMYSLITLAITGASAKAFAPDGASRLRSEGPSLRGSRTRSLVFRGFDSSTFLMLRGGIPRSIGTSRNLDLELRTIVRQGCERGVMGRDGTERRAQGALQPAICVRIIYIYIYIYIYMCAYVYSIV